MSAQATCRTIMATAKITWNIYATWKREEKTHNYDDEQFKYFLLKHEKNENEKKEQQKDISFSREECKVLLEK